MGPLLYGIGALAAAALGYYEYTKPRYIGDLAKAGPIGTGPTYGDQVEVNVADLTSGNNVTVGTAPGQIPAGTNTVVIAVLSATKDTLTGPITAFGTVPLTIPAGSFTVNRSIVKAVFRNGKVARAPSGQFAGERAKRFAG